LARQPDKASAALSDKLGILERLLWLFLTHELRHRIATFRFSPMLGRVPVIAAAAIFT
jgi:hypothetical protein